MQPLFSNVDELILKIHSAVFDADGWTQVVSAVSSALTADAAALIRPTMGATARPWCHLYEQDGAFITEYADHWGAQDVWFAGALRTGRIGVGVVSRDAQLVDRREFERSAFYNDYLRRMNIDRMMNVCLTAPESSGKSGPVALSVYRGGGREPFSSWECELLSHLAPHLAVAAKNYWSAQALRLLATMHQNALNALTCAVFGLDPSGLVTFTNRTAENLLRYPQWLRSVQGALSVADNVLETSALIQAIGRLCGGYAFSILATDRVSGGQAIVSGAPLALSAAGPYPAGVSALVWLIPIQPTTDSCAQLAKLFALSGAETRLLDRLILGEDLREAALALHISLHTARTQLKTIFDKSGRRTQTALLSFAARLSALQIPQDLPRR